MSNIINVVVKDADTPEDDIVVPDTGWYTSSVEQNQDTATPVFPIVAGVSCLVIVVFALILIFSKRKAFSAKNRAKKIGCFMMIAVLALSGISVLVHAITGEVAATDNDISITSSDTTITVVREEGAEATYGVATATIELNEITALGYNIFAYTPDGNVLHADTGDGVINPVDTNNSALSNNTWGIALTDQTNVKAEDSVWNRLGQESNPLLVASFDESTAAGTTVTLRYGVLVDSSLPVGVYSANIEYKAYQRAYTITFDPGEGQITTPTKPVIIGEQIGELPVPTRTYYNFAGWFTEDDQQINETTVPDGNTTYHAKWDRITYNITFDPGEGTITSGDASKTVQAGEPLGTLPEAARNYYTFDGWYTEGGTKINEGTEPTESTTYYAHWNRIEYVITFDLKGGNIGGNTNNPTATVQAGNKLGTLPQNPTKTNYTFAGWWTAETEGGTQVTTETRPDGSTTYFARWDRIEYTITFDLTGGNINGDTTSRTATVYAGDPLGTLPTEPKKFNYIFVGWFTQRSDGTKVTPDSIPGGTITYYAQWIEDSFPTVWNNVGACTFRATVSENHKTSSPQGLIGDQCDYAGYDYIDTGIQLYSNTNHDKDYEISFTIDSYDSADNVSQATFVNTKQENGDTDGTYPGMVVRRYDLIDKLDISSRKTSTANVRKSFNFDIPMTIRIVRKDSVKNPGYKAIYYSLNGSDLIEINDLSSFNPEFNLNVWFGATPTDSSANNAQRYLNGTMSNMYIKLGDYNDGTKYTVSFDANGGTTLEPTRAIVPGYELGTLPAPTRDGYEFDGWYTELGGGAQISANTIPSGDITYYARWISE